MLPWVRDDLKVQSHVCDHPSSANTIKYEMHIHVILSSLQWSYRLYRFRVNVYDEPSVQNHLTLWNSNQRSKCSWQRQTNQPRIVHFPMKDQKVCDDVKLFNQAKRAYDHRLNGPRWHETTCLRTHAQRCETKWNYKKNSNVAKCT